LVIFCFCVMQEHFSPTNEQQNKEVPQPQHEALLIAQQGDFEKIEKQLKEEGLFENELKRVKALFSERIDLDDFPNNGKELWDLLTIEELYDHDTALHSVETYSLAKEKIQKVLARNVVLAKIIQREGIGLEQFYFCCLVHDIGKVEIPEFIVNNPVSKLQWKEKLEDCFNQRDIPASILDKLGLDENTDNDHQAIIEELEKKNIQAEEITPVRLGISAQQAKELAEKWKISPEKSLMDILDMHSTYSQKILEKRGFSTEAHIVGQHHHKISSEKYPVSVESLQISSDLADLIHLADVEQALVSKRPYKDRFTPLEVLSALIEHSQKGLVGKEMSYLWIKDEYDKLDNSGKLDNLGIKERMISKSIENFLDSFEAGSNNRDLNEWIASHMNEGVKIENIQLREAA